MYTKLLLEKETRISMSRTKTGFALWRSLTPKRI